LRLASWLIPIMPLRASYALACTAGRLAYFLFPAPRRGIARNLAVTMDRPAGDASVKAAALRAFQNDAKNWVDTLRIGRLTNDQILASVAVDGWHHLEEAA